jgi:hypothetical protein
MIWFEGSMMAKEFNEKLYLAEMWTRGECANCGKPIGAFQRVGSGKKSEGGFCSLSCYGDYYAAELQARAKKARVTLDNTH